MKKLESLQLTDSEKEGIIKRFREDQSHLKKQLSQYERSLNDGMQERERLLKEIDTGKFENNRKAEEAIQILNNLKRSSSEIEDLKNRIKTLQESEENFKRSWRDAEIEKSRLHEINLALNLQVEDLKKNCCKYQAQLQDLTRDFMACEGRAKNLEERCKMLSYEKDLASNKNEEFAREIRSKIEFSAGLLEIKRI